jgi:transposase
MRKQYTAQFKAQVVQEIVKEEKSLNQLATEHGIHPNQLKRWKATVLEGLPSLFSKTDQAVQTAAEHERQVTELYAEIGRLTSELTWLKKSWPPCPGLNGWRCLNACPQNCRSRPKRPCWS